MQMYALALALASKLLAYFEVRLGGPAGPLLPEFSLFLNWWNHNKLQTMKEHLKSNRQQINGATIPASAISPPLLPHHVIGHFIW